MQDQGPTLAQAGPWIARHRGQRVVIKVGGAMLEQASARRAIARQIRLVREVGMHPIAVHGAGVQVDRLSAERGLPVVKHGGRRVTSPDVRDLLIEALTQLNESFAAAIAEEGGEVYGMAQGSHHSVKGLRRPPVMIDGQSVDFGCVADVKGAQIQAPEGAIPLIPSLAVDENGELCNANADGVAVQCALAVQADKLIFLTTAPGVMRSMDDDGPLSTMDEGEAQELIDSGAAKGGMKAKLEESLRALAGGVRQVHIVDGRDPHTLLRELFTDEGSGTLISRGRP
jgi:acetylglutamate kinase